MNPSSTRSANSLGQAAVPDMSDIVFNAAMASFSNLSSDVPAAVAPLVSHVRWDEMLSVSGRLAIQFRRLGMACLGSPSSAKGAGFIVDDPKALTPMAAGHAWVLGLAQRAAMEIRQIELLDETRSFPQMQVTEITTVALLAGTTNPTGARDRLSAALGRVAVALAGECQGVGQQAQFVCSKPSAIVSPINAQQAVPFAACRIRAIGMSAQELTAALTKAVRHAGEIEGEGTGEVLMLSNIWMAE